MSVTSDTAREKHRLRQERYRSKLKQESIIEVCLRIPADAESDFKILADRLLNDRDLSVGSPRRKSNGKLSKL